MISFWRGLMDAASDWNSLAIFLRLVLAMIVGMAVGIEDSSGGGPGLRPMFWSAWVPPWS